MVFCLFHQALAALNEYHAAVSETSVTIRNKPAYLMGILRKYKQGQRAPLGNGATGGMATTPNAMGRMGVRAVYFSSVILVYPGVYDLVYADREFSDVYDLGQADHDFDQGTRSRSGRS